MRLLRLFLPIIALFAATLAFALDAREVYQNASPSVVRITTLDEDGDPTGFGSGFFIGNGRVIATNYHVIEDAATLQVETIFGDVFQIRTIINTDKNRDLALLQSPQPGRPLKLSGRTHEIGELIAVIGNPEGLDHTVSRGIISAIRRDEGNVIYQIDAAVSEGSSGSPVLDEHGEVIAVASFIYTEGQNLNFAYSARYVQNLLATSDDVATEATEDTNEEWVAWTRNRAEQGNADAQYIFGLIYYVGEDVAQNYVEAVKWFRRAAEQGHAEAQYFLGWAYHEGDGVAQNYAEAAKWYRRSADQGDADAQNHLGLLYDSGEGLPQNHAEAVKWYRRAAEQGHATAQFNIGLSYDFGEGVAQDDAEAIKWYRRAAEQGHASAQFNLGNHYRRGDGVPQNYAEAVKWYRRAAEQGHASAQLNLGFAYNHGRGITQNDLEAVKWYRRAAEQGLATAQSNLGNMYGAGMGVSQNYAEAVKWYRRAAEQGNSQAQYNLGVAYWNGQGVPENDVEAYIWYSIAAASGDKDAAEKRSRTAERLSSAALSAAQQEAARRYKEIQSKTQ